MAVILVLRALGLGDALTGIPALRALRRAYPDDRIVLAAPTVLWPLLGLTGAVDELLPTTGLGTLDWRAARPPALAVNLHGSGPQSLRDLLRTRPAQLLTHQHPALPVVAGPPWRPDLPEIDRWCRLLEWAGIPADRTELHLRVPAITAPGRVVVHPGAASAARRWPPERFAAVAAQLDRAGYEVVLTGSDAEQELAQKVASAAGLAPGQVLAGALDLAGLASVVAGARLVICGDTGIGHLATATGTPSVLLFGPTPPRLWGPSPWLRSRHTVLWAEHTGNPHANTPDPGLLTITADQVLTAAAALLSMPPVPPLEKEFHHAN